MKTLYLECSMGAAGDMICAALFELIDDKEKFLKEINSLGLPKVKVEVLKAIKCSINGSQMKVSIDGKEEISEDYDISSNHQNHNDNDNLQTDSHIYNEHSATNLKTIESIVSNLLVSQKIKENILSVYDLIAQAESKAHNKPISQIHFHEVGNLDAIADIAIASILIDKISPSQIIVSPINTGSGFVKCLHGIMPVPTPATANILIGVPVFVGNIKAELCTPTGAALLKHFASSFGQMPCMEVHRIGYGMGKKDFEISNCVRAFLGESKNKIEITTENKTETNNIQDEVAKLECNIDDMTGEAIAYAIELLLDKGALDVWIQSIQMKKNRPAVLLSCLCQIHQSDYFASLILKHTSSFGLRKSICSRYKLNRAIEKVATKYGDIEVKIGKGFGIKKYKLEYESVKKIASLKDISYEDVLKETYKVIEEND
jgi:uncharacterized protein (TIGR00299 family) protein